MSLKMQCPSYIRKTLQFPAELAEFQAFVSRLEPHSYLEIGCKYGGSFWAIANVMPFGSRVVAVDLPSGPERVETQASLTRCCHDLIRLGYDAHLIIGDSSFPRTLERISEYGPYDLILIDGNHTEKYVRADFKNYGPMGKVVCFHDVGWDSKNQKAGALPIDVPKVWQELKQTHADRATFREIKHDRGHNGFGIMQWLPT